MSENKKLTSASGIPYFNNEDTMSVGARGPLLHSAGCRTRHR